MRDKDWRRLRKDYRRKGLVLVLGAGVSKLSGLPDWEELLRRLEGEVRAEGDPPVLDTLKNDSYSLPAIVSVLEAAYRESKKDFARAIQEQLYLDFPFRSRLKTDGDKQKFIGHEKLRRNKTLRAVAAVCAVRRPDGSFGPNPCVHAIVTTNVDSVLRSYVSARWGDILRSIDRASAGRVSGRIPVYYMHGFIRFDRDIGEVTHHAADLRVFTEQEFFDFFGDPNGLYNYTLLYLLREYPCLFIGVSFKDDNIRRLLHYSKKERVESYLNEGESRERAEGKSTRHYLLAKSPEAGERLATLTEQSLGRLGVRALWVESHDQISERLGMLYQSTRPRLSWGDVFDQ